MRPKTWSQDQLRSQNMAITSVSVANISFFLDDYELNLRYKLRTQRVALTL